MAIEHTFLSKDGSKTKILTPIKAIREKCLECSAWSFYEVKLCPNKNCAIYPFRMGKRPVKSK
jgi:hypothetical protein